MKSFINKVIAQIWCFKHMHKAYSKYLKQMQKDPHLIKEYPLAETPTQALEQFLKSMDGKEMSSSHYQFTMMCKREYEIRQQLTKG